MFLAFIMFLVLIYGFFTISPALYMSKQPSEAQKQKIVLTGHRGAAGTAPENTLISVSKALAFGCDRIEVDVQQSKDGQVVVLHDRTLERTTNGSGFVETYTLDELKKLDAGSKFDKKFAGEKIPTLDEVFELIDGKSVFLIEIKDGSETYPDIEKHVVESIHKYNAHHWVIVHSFNDHVLEKVHQLDSTIVLHKLLIGDLPLLPLFNDGNWNSSSFASYDYCTEISLYYKFVTPSFIRRMHKLGKKVNVWTVNDQKQIETIMAMGADGIITNFPERVPRN